MKKNGGSARIDSPPIDGIEMVRFSCFLMKDSGEAIVHGDVLFTRVGHIESMSFKVSFIC